MPEVDYFLRGQVADVQRMVEQLGRAIGQVGHQVTAVSQEQAQTRSELTQLRDDFNAYVRQHQLTANLQRAEIRRTALQGEIEYKFGHHKVVRRTAVGILQAFDVGLVSEEVVRAVGEELMVQTPRYWLAPVLVALAAWAGDEPDLCRRAVEEAYRRSPSRTCLFMALVLRRQGRRDAAVRWLGHYLEAQDPAALGRDFAVILEAISQGAFGPAGLRLVQGYLERWRQRLVTEDAITDAQVARWRAELDSHTTPARVVGRFPRLAATSPQWPQLLQALSAAQSQQSVLDRYQAMFAEELTPSDRLEDAVDDILDRLVEEYDPEELPLRRELAFSEAVIDHGGDVDLATRAITADEAAMESTLDYLTVQTTSALNPDAIGVSRSTQRLAVAACHEWFARAHALFARDYRAAVPANVEVVLDASHTVAARQFQLPRWVGSLNQPLEQLERSLASHWDRHTTTFLAGLAFDDRKWIGPILTAVAGLVFVGVCAQSFIAGLLTGLVAGGIWALILANQRSTAQQRQQEAYNFLARVKAESIRQLRAASGELTDWRAEFAAADALEPKVRQMIESLPTYAHAPQPYERRGVTQTAVPSATQTAVLSMAQEVAVTEENLREREQQQPTGGGADRGAMGAPAQCARGEEDPTVTPDRDHTAGLGPSAPG
jgi:hypothetical protein